MNAALPKRPFVVLDRDGTIIVERHYLSDPEQVELIPGVGSGLRRLSQMGLGLIVVTNQSGIGRGYFDQARLNQIHERMNALLAAEGVRLDGIYFCPHSPEEACHCRKPETGMVERAAEEVGLDPTASFVVGDNWADMELGRRIGATTLLVRTGYGAQVEPDLKVTPHCVVDDLAAAALAIQRLVAQGRRATANENGS